MSDKPTINPEITRLKQFRLKQNATQEDFALALGIKQGSYSDIERGKVGISGLVLKNLIMKYRINPTWLYDGTGEMHSPLPGEKNASLNASLNASPTEKPVKNVQPSVQPIANVHEPTPAYQAPVQISYNVELDRDVKLIPMLDNRAAAGLPADYKNVHFWEELPTFPVPASQFRGDFISIQVSGNSMYPTLKEGDWLIAKRIESVEDVREGYVHVVVSRDGTVVKRVLNRLNTRKALALKSDNKRVATYLEKAENILQVFRVEAYLSYDLSNVSEDIFNRLNDIEVRLTMIEKEKKTAIE